MAENGKRDRIGCAKAPINAQCGTEILRILNPME
jgi:hypothetical protein